MSVFAVTCVPLVSFLGKSRPVTRLEHLVHLNYFMTPHDNRVLQHSRVGTLKPISEIQVDFQNIETTLFSGSSSRRSPSLWACRSSISLLETIQRSTPHGRNITKSAPRNLFKATRRVLIFRQWRNFKICVPRTLKRSPLNTENSLKPPKHAIILR